MKPDETAAAARGSRLHRTPAARGTCVRPPPDAARARPIERSRHGRSTGRSNVKAWPITTPPRPSAAASAASRADRAVPPPLGATVAPAGSGSEKRMSSPIDRRPEGANPVQEPRHPVAGPRPAPGLGQAPLVDLDEGHAPGRHAARGCGEKPVVDGQIGPGEERGPPEVESREQRHEPETRAEEPEARRPAARGGTQNHDGPHRTPAPQRLTRGPGSGYR